MKIAKAIVEKILTVVIEIDEFNKKWINYLIDNQEEISTDVGFIISNAKILVSY